MAVRSCSWSLRALCISFLVAITLTVLWVLSLTIGTFEASAQLHLANLNSTWVFFPKRNEAVGGKKDDASIKLMQQLWVCHLFPKACFGQFRKRNILLDSAIQMHQNILGLGGRAVSFLVVACAAVGLWQHLRWEKLGAARPRQRMCDGQAADLCSCHNMIVGWWDSDLGWRLPGATLKLFVAALLIIELNYLLAPEPSGLALPEVVKLNRRLPKISNQYAIMFASWFMPNLDHSTADEWTQWLYVVRCVLLMSWSVYLLAWPGWRTLTVVSFFVGASCYSYLVVMISTYHCWHGFQAPLLFVTVAMAALPDLDTEQRSGIWLRQVLLRGILVPIYLASGISKFRYLGLELMISGSWIKKALKANMYRSSVPFITNYIAETSWLCMFFLGYHYARSCAASLDSSAIGTKPVL